MGEYTDEFGCEWHVGEPGVVGEKGPAIKEIEDVDSYEMPWEILDNADLSKVNELCAKTDKFVLAGTYVRPFERLQFLRGTENLFMDLAYAEEEIYKLRDKLHQFECRELEMIADTDVDGISFMDDWGTQISLLISPDKWREFFKPLYKKYVEIIHSKGKYAFFHSDGCIESIYSDLVEIGIDAINSQLFCMNIEKIVDQYGDKITFWGEIDRQKIIPFGSVKDVESAVDRVYKAVYKKNGKNTGIIAQCEWCAGNPYENIEVVFKRWDSKSQMKI